MTLLALALLSACSRLEPPAQRASNAPTSFLDYLQPTPIGDAATRPPWIAHVHPVDLDADGLLDVVVSEAQENRITWVRQTARGEFVEQTLAANLAAPVHVESADMDADGDLDLIVSSMGYVFPNNDRIGAVVILENDGRENFTPHHVLEKTVRVTDARAADFDGDGKLDLVLAQFGYDQGQVRWMRRTGPWEFESHIVLELSGAINVCVDDFDGDHRTDFVVLVSQQWEEIYLFHNRGHGRFERTRIWGSTNEDYGSSGISVCDLNRDARPDVLYTNGDGFGPAVTPGPRSWHGVQWLENASDGVFRYHRIGDLPGAYAPTGVDLDQDGAMDVIAVAAYASWDPQNPAPSLMWFRNNGQMAFSPRVLARAPKDQVTLAVGDFDGTGVPTLVTGGFYVFAPFDDLRRITLWRRPRGTPP